jgi:hypothetical protein
MQLRNGDATHPAGPNQMRSPKPDPPPKKKHRQTRRLISITFFFLTPSRLPSEPYLNGKEKILVDQSQTHPRVRLQLLPRSPAIRSLSLKQNPPKIKQFPDPKTEEETQTKERKAGAHDRWKFSLPLPPLSIHGAGDVRWEMMR